MAERAVTIHIEDVPRESILHALIAIERADRQIFDAGQHDSLTVLVLGLRGALDG